MSLYDEFASEKRIRPRKIDADWLAVVKKIGGTPADGREGPVWNRRKVADFFSAKRGKRFTALPAYSAEELSPESIARNAPTGWAIPAEAFTREPADESAHNTMRAWIRDLICPRVGIDPDTVELRGARVKVKGHRDPIAVVMVYRKR